MSYRAIGKAVERVEGPEKVSGKATYAADIRLKGLVWGKVLRSPYPHARIISINTARARSMPGVLLVLTAQDIPDRLVGRWLCDMPVLARERVRFVGEKVAVVAAETVEEAEEAAAQIEVSYDELPQVLDPTEAMKEGATLVHENLSSYRNLPQPPSSLPNVHSHMTWSLGDIEQGFHRSARIFEHTFRTQLDHHGYLEPHASTLAVDESGKIEVWTSNKAPFRLRTILADAIGVSEDRIKINLVPIGGDFGGKGSLMDLPLCYHIAAITGRPVKMVMSYGEELIAGNPRHPSQITLRTGLNRDGQILARQATVVFNSGAYGAFKPMPSVNIQGASHAEGGYRIPNIRIDAYSVYTNSVPCGHMRAPGEPQIIFAVESHMDMIAHELGIDPLQFRDRNLLEDGDVLPNGHHLESVRSRETLQRAVEASGWTNAKRAGVGRGIGLSHRHVGMGESNTELQLETNGEVRVTTMMPDTGTGSHTILRQIVAEELALPLERISVRAGSTDSLPPDSGTGASRVTHVAGQAAHKAATLLREAMVAKAAELLQTKPGDISLKDGKFLSPAGTMRFDRLARELTLEGPYTVVGNYKARGPVALASFTAQVAEVHVDRETGEVRLLQFVTAHDVGTVIHPIAHQGQIEGGVIMGVGFGLMEELASQEGRISTPSMADFKIPNIKDIPRFKTLLLEEPIGPVPYRGKAIGENSIGPVAGAIANALYDAVGVRITELPITAEKVYRALQQQGP